MTNSKQNFLPWLCLIAGFLFALFYHRATGLTITLSALVYILLYSLLLILLLILCARSICRYLYFIGFFIWHFYLLVNLPYYKIFQQYLSFRSFFVNLNFSAVQLLAKFYYQIPLEIYISLACFTLLTSICLLSFLILFQMDSRIKLN